MTHCAYLYRDPKTGVYRYVGKGTASRPYVHLKQSHNSRLDRMLKKRIREGFILKPIVIEASSDDDAKEIEMLLIRMIGREDVGTGSLFNKTDGGDGSNGMSVDTKKSISEAVKKTQNRKTSEQKMITFQRSSESQKLKHRAKTEDEWAKTKDKISKIKGMPCTVDFVQVFSSRAELVRVLGQGKNGSRSKGFCYLSDSDLAKLGMVQN